MLDDKIKRDDAGRAYISASSQIKANDVLIPSRRLTEGDSEAKQEFKRIGKFPDPKGSVEPACPIRTAPRPRSSWGRGGSTPNPAG